MAAAVSHLLPRISIGEAAPAWPPDLFAVAATLLKNSGAYVHALSGDDFNPEWARRARGLGEAWATAWSQALSRVLDDEHKDVGEVIAAAGARVKAPSEVAQAWAQVRAARDTDISRIGDDRVLSCSLIRLCALADETCRGVGFSDSFAHLHAGTSPTPEPAPLADAALFVAFAEYVLQLREAETLCWSVSPETVRVLPKQRTPQRGATLRSLTHHLALIGSSEVRVRWNVRFESRSAHQPTMNLLLLPWPLHIAATDFSLAHAEGHLRLPEEFRFFEYRHQYAGGVRHFASELSRTLDAAASMVDRIDGVVFPELALNWREYQAAERLCIRMRALLVAGVNLSARELERRAFVNDAGKVLTGNAVFIQPHGLTTAPTELIDHLRTVQLKHHRWCLDRAQILQYGLGGVLPATRDCWEASHVGTRSLQFLNIGKWLTLAVLVCEDLARQDPMADVIRSVGPNLVLALLLDGPQLKGRWGSRYASVLAEDPGSSVLTLPSRGMSRLTSQAQPTKSRDQVIALWRDRVHGEEEIELAEGAAGCILSLACQTTREYSIDGRDDMTATHTPIFAGVRQVFGPAVAPSRSRE